VVNDHLAKVEMSMPLANIDDFGNGSFMPIVCSIDLDKVRDVDALIVE
jgi:hypothetical protein